MVNLLTSVAACSTIQLPAYSCTLDQLSEQLSVQSQVYILRCLKWRPLLTNNCLTSAHRMQTGNFKIISKMNACLS